VTAALSLLALVGCGEVDRSDVAAAKASATSPTPAAEEMLSPEAFSDLVGAALDGATSAHVTLSMGDTKMEAEGDIDFRATPPRLAVTMSMPQLAADEVEMRLVDGVMYLKNPMLGDGFLSIDLTDPDNPFGLTLGTTFDVAGMLERVRTAVISATYDGTDVVQGDSTDHYTATVDAAKMLAGLPPQLRAPGGGSVPDTLDYEFWLDDQGLLRQVQVGADGEAQTKLTYADWGTPVSIEAPPADEVSPLGQVGI
jgi:hypothetical protein